MTMILFFFQLLIVVGVMVYYTNLLKINAYYTNALTETPYKIGLRYKDRYSQSIGNEFLFAIYSIADQKFSMYRYKRKDPPAPGHHDKAGETPPSVELDHHVTDKDPSEWMYNVPRQKFVQYNKVRPAIELYENSFKITLPSDVSAPNSTNTEFITLPPGDSVILDIDSLKLKPLTEVGPNLLSLSLNTAADQQQQSQTCTIGTKKPVTARVYKTFLNTPININNTQTHTIPKIYLECVKSDDNGDGTTQQWRMSECRVHEFFDTKLQECKHADAHDNNNNNNGDPDGSLGGSVSSTVVSSVFTDTQAKLLQTDHLTIDELNCAHIDESHDNDVTAAALCALHHTHRRLSIYNTNLENRHRYVIGELQCGCNNKDDDDDATTASPPPPYHNQLILCDFTQTSMTIQINKYSNWTVSLPRETFNLVEKKCQPITNSDIQNFNVNYLHFIPYKTLAISGWTISFDEKTQSFFLEQNIALIKKPPTICVVPTLDSKTYFQYQQRENAFSLRRSELDCIVYKENCYFITELFQRYKNQLIQEQQNLHPYVQTYWSTNRTICAMMLGTILLDITIQHAPNDVNELNYSQMNDDFQFIPSWTEFIAEQPSTNFVYFSTQQLYNLPVSDAVIKHIDLREFRKQANKSTRRSSM